VSPEFGVPGILIQEPPIPLRAAPDPVKPSQRIIGEIGRVPAGNPDQPVLIVIGIDVTAVGSEVAVGVVRECLTADACILVDAVGRNGSTS